MKASDLSLGMEFGFKLGSVVIPALDSTLYSLSLKFKPQSLEHLGVVVEVSKNKSKVLFSAENICLWMPNDELMAFKNSDIITGQVSQILNQNELYPRDIVFVLNDLSNYFDFKTITGLELGNSISEVWNTPDKQSLPNDLGDSNRVAYFGFTVGEVFLEKIDFLKDRFKNSLLYLRIIPSSLSKIEISLFVRFK